MKLNPDCIRDILLTIEDNTGYGDEFSYPREKTNYPLLAKYSENEVRYHLDQCRKSGLANFDISITDNYSTEDLEPKGHEVLSKMRDETLWNRFKASVSPSDIFALIGIIRSFTV